MVTVNNPKTMQQVKKMQSSNEHNIEINDTVQLDLGKYLA